METEEEVDILMSSDVYSATLSTKSITFSRAQTGWLFREDKTVGVDHMTAPTPPSVPLALFLEHFQEFIYQSKKKRKPSGTFWWKHDEAFQMHNPFK